MWNPIQSKRRRQRVVQARNWHRHHHLREARLRNSDLLRFLRQYATTPDAGRIVLGRATTPGGTHVWVGADAEELLGQHELVVGATGAGKSIAVLTRLDQFRRVGVPVNLIVFDMKGELAALVGALIASRPHLWNLSRLTVIRPFGTGNE